MSLLFSSFLLFGCTDNEVRNAESTPTQSPIADTLTRTPTPKPTEEVSKKVEETLFTKTIIALDKSMIFTYNKITKGASFEIRETPSNKTTFGDGKFFARMQCAVLLGIIAHINNYTYAKANNITQLSEDEFYGTNEQTTGLSSEEFRNMRVESVKTTMVDTDTKENLGECVYTYPNKFFLDSEDLVATFNTTSSS